MSWQSVVILAALVMFAALGHGAWHGEETAVARFLVSAFTGARVVGLVAFVRSPHVSILTGGSAMNFTIYVRVLSDRNATVASVTLPPHPLRKRPVGLPGITATGSAKREQGDVHDPDIAARLAVGRALEKLGRDLCRDGYRKVQAAESEQVHALRHARQHRQQRPVPTSKPALPVREIKERYGEDAAKRAQTRRPRRPRRLRRLIRRGSPS